MLPPKFCACCGDDITQGEAVVRVQYGRLNMLSGHYHVIRKASTDDYFCTECAKKGNVAIKGVE